MAAKTFETMIENIENLLTELDNKEIPLEEAVGKYKEGMKLIEACSGKLEKVEKELRIVEDKIND
jgi:exodeoxyribonuclease VII small subunit